jgi:DNA polymerase I-like protein with 3'-5' exonuclease and polymerase domains
MKTIVLAIIFGKGIGSLMADLKQDYAATVQNLNQFATVMPELGSPTYHHEDGEWKKDKPHVRTYREEVWEMLRYSGEVTTLFGRKRRFPGLYHLRKCQRCRVTTYEGGKEYVWDIAPVQLWNYTVHAYVYRVWHAKTGTLIGTNNWRGNYAILHKEKSLTAWPFQQLSFRTIRRIEVGQDLVHFTPIEDLHREGFNAAIQATAGDVFKLAILRVNSLLPTFGARMILNVHDELVFSVPNQHLNQFVPAMVQAMTTPPASWWEIPIAVDVETGPNYGQLSHFELTA